MSSIVVTKGSGEIVALISDKYEAVVLNGYDITVYGDTEPVFVEDNDGKVYLDLSRFIIDTRRAE